MEDRSVTFLLQPLEMRMQLRGAKDGGYLLEDTYSSI